MVDNKKKVQLYPHAKWNTFVQLAIHVADINTTTTTGGKRYTIEQSELYTQKKHSSAS